MCYFVCIRGQILCFHALQYEYLHGMRAEVTSRSSYLHLVTCSLFQSCHLVVPRPGPYIFSLQWHTGCTIVTHLIDSLWLIMRLLVKRTDSSALQPM